MAEGEINVPVAKFIGLPDPDSGQVKKFHSKNKLPVRPEFVKPAPFRKKGKDGRITS